MNICPYVSSVFQYPLKSGAALESESLEVDFSGPIFDRKWMIVNKEGEFITGRTHPRLVTLKPNFDGRHITLRYGTTQSNPIAVPREKTMQVRVWKDTFKAFVAEPYANEFVSEFLGEPAMLVYSDSSERRVRWQSSHSHAFSDAAPLLVIAKASIDLIAKEARLSPDPRRFRPNIVLDGLPAFGEDELGLIELGSAQIQLVDGCSRCDFTLVDPETGLVNNDGEPVDTLQRLRKNDVGIYLGVNAIVTKPGIVRLGDKVKIISKKDPVLFNFDIDNISFPRLANEVQELRLVDKPFDNADYFSLKLETKKSLDVLAGQYVCLEFNGCDIENKSYSVISYTHPHIVVAIKKVKDQTSSPHLIKNLPKGQLISLLEIGGAFPHISSAADNQLWLSAGSGVTPFLGLLSSLAIRGKNPSVVWLHYGNSQLESELIKTHLKSHTQSLSQLKYHYFNTKKEGRVHRNHFEAHVLDLRDRVTLCCGPKGFRNLAREILAGFGLSIPKRFFVERYGPEEVEIPLNIELRPGSITISSQNKTIETLGNQTVLKALADEGINLHSLCKAGECGRCKFKLVSGELSQIGFELLTSDQKSRGLRLACVNVNKGDIEIEIENV